MGARQARRKKGNRMARKQARHDQPQKTKESIRAAKAKRLARKKAYAEKQKALQHPLVTNEATIVPPGQNPELKKEESTSATAVAPAANTPAPSPSQPQVAPVSEASKEASSVGEPTPAAQ